MKTDLGNSFFFFSGTLGQLLEIRVWCGMGPGVVILRETERESGASRSCCRISSVLYAFDLSDLLGM
jgi:hypothetical protein